MRKVLSFLAGLILGGLTGGVAALLFAPAPGDELKKQIQHYIDHLIEEGKSAAEARRLELEQQLEAFKQGRPIVLEETPPA